MVEAEAVVEAEEVAPEVAAAEECPEAVEVAVDLEAAVVEGECPEDVSTVNSYTSASRIAIKKRFRENNFHNI